MSSMNGGQQPSHVAKLSVQALEDSERWFGDTVVVHSIPHHALALAGEVGEFANLVKKIERGTLQMGDAKVRHAMAMELADVFTYTLDLAALMGIDLEKAYKTKRAENEQRFTQARKERERRAG